jgi:type II secretory pathway component PulL
MDRAGWRYALGWYLLVQLISRVLTPANLNVNIAHYVDPRWQQTFNAYWKFWLVATLLAAILLWTIGTALHRIWPTKRTATSVFNVAPKSNVG